MFVGVGGVTNFNLGTVDFLKLDRGDSLLEAKMS